MLARVSALLLARRPPSDCTSLLFFWHLCVSIPSPHAHRSPFTSLHLPTSYTHHFTLYIFLQPAVTSCVPRVGLCTCMLSLPHTAPPLCTHTSAARQPRTRSVCAHTACFLLQCLAYVWASTQGRCLCVAHQYSVHFEDMLGCVRNVSSFVYFNL